MKKIYLVVSLIFIYCAKGQILLVDPVNPTTDDTVTIIFDATNGKGTLANYNGPVFAHTGLITTASIGPNHWFFV